MVDADVTESEVLAALDGAEQEQLADLLEKVLASEPPPRRKHHGNS